ncbi:hypothetical protein LTR17_006713 [Elasticomyces elasticus]|nr:hypothetical protein LTR17_006713 [Elasticomyces elasticus]
MAEALSIAASAIQTADAGFKLYGALSQYIRDYVDANKQIKRIADEVRTTSWALQQLGALLKEDDDIKLCRPEAISETEAALNGCQSAFDEVREIVKDFLPPPAVAADLDLTKTISRRWKWPLKKAKAQLLLAQLERLKTTILLVFKVLSYASKLASRPPRKDVELLDEKTQLSFLLKAKQEAVRVEARLLAAETGRSGPLERHAGESNSCRDVNMLPTHIRPFPSSVVEVNAFVPSRVVASTNSMPDHRHTSLRVAQTTGDDETVPLEANNSVPFSIRKRRLITQLDDCAAAVKGLTLTLERAIYDLHSDAELKVHDVTRCFRATKRAIDELVLTELDADSEDATSDIDLAPRFRATSRKQRRSRSTPRDHMPTPSQQRHPQFLGSGTPSKRSQIAGAQPLDQQHSPPDSVIPSLDPRDVDFEFVGLPLPVQDGNERENEFVSRVSEAPTASERTSTSNVKSPKLGAGNVSIAGQAAGGLEAVGATGAGYNYSAPDRDVQAMGKARVYAIQQRTQGVVTNMNAHDMTTHPVSSYSFVHASHAPGIRTYGSAMIPPTPGPVAEGGMAKGRKPLMLSSVRSAFKALARFNPRRTFGSRPAPVPYQGYTFDLARRPSDTVSSVGRMQPYEDTSDEGSDEPDVVDNLVMKWTTVNV